jgi:hypothetical protein
VRFAAERRAYGPIAFERKDKDTERDGSAMSSQKSRADAQPKFRYTAFRGRLARFFKEPSPLTAIQAAWPTWHVHEWVWHEKQKSLGSLLAFRQLLLKDCPELGWVRDVTDASKHCGLENPHMNVGKAAGTGRTVKGEISDVFGSRSITHSDPLLLTVDGRDSEFAAVLRTAIGYWEANGYV